MRDLTHVYGHSPLDAQYAHATDDLSRSTSPVDSTLSKLGSRVSTGLTALFAEAGQALKTAVNPPPQPIMTPSMLAAQRIGGSSASGGGGGSSSGIGSGPSSHPTVTANASLASRIIDFAGSPQPGVRRPSTSLAGPVVPGVGAVGHRMGVRLEDVLRVLEGEVAAMLASTVGGGGGGGGGAFGGDLSVPLSRSTATESHGTVERSMSTQSISSETGSLHDLDLSDSASSGNLAELASAQPRAVASPDGIAPVNPERLRKCIGDLKTIRDVLLGRLQDDGGAVFSA